MRWLLPLGFLAVVLALLGQQIGDFDMVELQRTLLNVPTLPALGIAALALAGVASTGLVDVLIGRWLRLAVPRRELLGLAFLANVLANTLNLSGAVGAAVRLMGLTSQRVELPRAAALVGMRALSLPLGLSIPGVAGPGHGQPAGHAGDHHALARLGGAGRRGAVCAAVSRPHRAAAPDGLAAGTAAAAVLAAAAGAHGDLAAGLAACCCHALCLPLRQRRTSSRACCSAPSPGASVLGLVSLVPGGLGVFDGLVLLSLTSAGYDQPQVLSGLFLFRIAYYLLPLFVGLLPARACWRRACPPWCACASAWPGSRCSACSTCRPPCWPTSACACWPVHLRRRRAAARLGGHTHRA